MIRKFNGKRPKIANSAFVSEAAYVIGDVFIGDYSSVWPGAVIRADFGRIEVGEKTCIEDHCVVHGASDVIIGNGVIIGHGVILHCREIGDRVLVGNNATLLDGAQIGSFCIIGAGTLVPGGMKVPDNSLVMGIPAQIKGPLSPEQRLQLENGPEVYAKLAQQYKELGL